MSDGSINVQSSEIGGYEPQGSIEIAAPGALRAVTEKPKRRKIGHGASAACGGRPRLGYTLDEGKRTERETTNCPPKRVRSNRLVQAM